MNIVDAEAAIVCSIGLDHADWLGTDIEVIGREKAGVFRPGAIAVLADPSMTPSVEQEARRLCTRTLVAGRDYQWDVGRQDWSFTMGALLLAHLPPPALPGRTQFANASAALAALGAMGLLATAQLPQVSRALQSLSLPGRFQVVPARSSGSSTLRTTSRLRASWRATSLSDRRPAAPCASPPSSVTRTSPQWRARWLA